jgi:hypothetical protein
MDERVGSGGEVVAKHRQTALRFGFCRLVLQDVPVFGKAGGSKTWLIDRVRIDGS